MDINKINISSIETFLYEKINNIVSDNTFVGSELPNKTAIPDDWNDICLIDIPNGIRDLEAYGRGTVLVWLCARPMESGRKNVFVLSNMEQKLNEVIKSNADKTYQMSRRLSFSTYSPNIDWHCNVVEIVLSVY